MSDTGLSLHFQTIYNDHKNDKTNNQLPTKAGQRRERTPMYFG